jgi:large subunit ribosomal protein L24
MRETKLKEGDTVLIIAGGNKSSNQLKGRTGKIIRFVGSRRVLVSGLNLVSKHKRAQSADKPAGIKLVEAPISIANVMFYVDSIQRPVRLKLQKRPDGKNIRGYLDPVTKGFVPV